MPPSSLRSYAGQVWLRRLQPLRSHRVNYDSRREIASGRRSFNRLDPFAGNHHDPQSLHKYDYVYDDPVNAVDPSGLSPLTEISVAQLLQGVVRAIKKIVSWHRTKSTYDKARWFAKSILIATSIALSMIDLFAALRGRGDLPSTQVLEFIILRPSPALGQPLGLTVQLYDTKIKVFMHAQSRGRVGQFAKFVFDAQKRQLSSMGGGGSFGLFDDGPVKFVLLVGVNAALPPAGIGLSIDLTLLIIYAPFAVFEGMTSVGTWISQHARFKCFIPLLALRYDPRMGGISDIRKAWRVDPIFTGYFFE